MQDFAQLAVDIKRWGQELGFQQVGITDTNLQTSETRLKAWLENEMHGEMDFMAKHGTKRTRPAELVPGTVRVISARLNYLPANTECIKTLNNPSKGYLSRYALGKDYHKLMRKRLEKLAQRINQVTEHEGYRAFCDSAPVMEKPLAEKAGLGWIGKHTNIINKKAGSWFFLGELFTNLPLPVDEPIVKSHCGSCHACMSICPTQAITAPYQLDARRCISYLTIELKGPIPVEFRRLLGNRIYGCDDCQLVCPWNKFAKFTNEQAFHPRHQLATPELLDLFAWDKATFLLNTQGSSIRRIGYECWVRNIAVALGNANFNPAITHALLRKQKLEASPLIQEHIDWALIEQSKKAT